MQAFKKYVFLLFFFVSVTYVNSQKEAAKWCLTGGVVLNFMTGPTSVNFSSNTSYAAHGPSISDPVGNLLFYNGSAAAIPVSLFNRLNLQMPNSVYTWGNNGNNQYAFIVKQPGNANLYYHFLSVNYGTSNHIQQRYAIIDMNLAAGMGSVTAKDVPLNTSSSNRMAGVKHCNGNDVWILSRDSAGSVFSAYLLTASGINSPVISVAGTPTASSEWGSMKVSANGKKICVVNQAQGNVELFDFDNTSGIVSNHVVLAQVPNPNFSAGAFYCEFSPDGTKLYVGNFGGGIFQWDLCAGSNAAVAASQYSIASIGTYVQQLGIDGKIYVGRTGLLGPTPFYGVINNPNVAGAGCNYTDFGISVAPRFADSFLPGFISSYFVQKPQQAPFTFTLNPQPYCNSVAFTAAASQTAMGCAASGFTLLGTAWEFGDPASGSANASTLTNPVHIYSAPGTYTPKLIFYYSCGGGTDTLKQTVTIVSPTVAISTTSITCANLGSATVSAGGGIGPYTYTWQPVAQTGSAAIGLIPGNYTVTLFDVGSSCLANYTAYLAPLIPLTGNINNSSSLTCPGAANGTANVTGIAGGSGAETYLWYNGSLTYTNVVANSLSAGLWSVTVTDALTGCQINQSFFITQPPPFILNLSSNTPTTCAGTNIILTGINSGGTPFTSGPGYTYTWSTAPPGNTTSVSQTTAGTYIYTLSSNDANNCLTSNTISVDFIANPVLVVSNVSICPLTVGTLTVSGASTYTWTGGITGNTYTQSPLGSGQYTVIGSALGCTSAATASISVMPLPSPFLSSNSPRCEGSSLFLNAAGGASYAWSGPNGFNSVSANNNFNSLSLSDAGVYNVTVTAANSCTAAATKTIVVNPTPTLSATGSTVCTSQTLNLSASSSATTFLWTGPLSFTSNLQNPFITNPLVTNTGTYTVKATSPQSCTNTAIARASVVLPPSLTAQLSSYSLCSQAFNGSPNTITLTAGGANTYTLVTVPDMFNANPAGPISPLTAIPPNTGAASATLSGSNGVCTATAGLTFSIIPNPTVSVGSNTPVICAGDTYTYTSQGAGSYTWSSATPGFTTYNNGGVAVANPSIHSVFSVFGASLGCNSASETSTITVNPLPLINLLPTSPTVCIGSKVNLIATGTGNSYTWSPYLNINSMYGSTVNAFPNIQQTYTVVGSLNSCTSTAMITVSVLTLPSPIATVLKPTVCLNETITLQGFGGETYQWYGPNSIYYEGQTVNFAANSFMYTGIYTLTVADKNNCKASALTSVTINSLPDGSLLGTQMRGCVPFKSEFNYYSALATSTNIATLWTVDSKLFTTKTFSNEFKVPGNYTITGNFKDTLTNCLNTRTFGVEAYPVPLADFSYLPERPIENLDEVIFTNTSKGEEQKKWDWFFVNNQGYRSQNKNTAYLFTEAGIYPIAMIVANNWGCADTVVKSLKIESDLTVYVPNVFTPNGDDLNEFFLPIVRAIKSYELLVFDRWGTKIFSTTNTGVGWDGTYRGEQCKMDVYVWKINLSSVNGEMKTLTGSVLLSR